jgi:hypothetical protein
VSWSVQNPHDDVAIRLTLRGTGTGNWWITDSLGPGTSQSDQVMSGDFSFSTGADDSWITIASGVHLDPGTYFLVVIGSGGGVQTATSYTYASPDAQFHGGFTAMSSDAGYVPASNFSPSMEMMFEVSSAPVPEPGTVSLAALGLSIPILLRLRKHRDRQLKGRGAVG